MKIKLVLLTLFLGGAIFANDGVGGTGGGPGSKIWTLDIPRWTTPHFPVVRVREGRSLTINHFCIQDESTLRTLQKYERYGFRFSRTNLIEYRRVEAFYETADRYYDDFSCQFSNSANCDVDNQYIEDIIEVPIYSGRPGSNRDGEISISEYANNAPLKEIKRVKLPHCKKD